MKPAAYYRYAASWPLSQNLPASCCCALVVTGCHWSSLVTRSRRRSDKREHPCLLRTSVAELLQKGQSDSRVPTLGNPTAALPADETLVIELADVQHAVSMVAAQPDLVANYGQCPKPRQANACLRFTASRSSGFPAVAQPIGKPLACTEASCPESPRVCPEP